MVKPHRSEARINRVSLSGCQFAGQL